MCQQVLFENDVAQLHVSFGMRTCLKLSLRP